MTTSNAERQAAYRQRRTTAGDNGERKLGVYVSTSVKLALTRLAKRYDITEKEMLERLITDADEAVKKSLHDDSEFERYMS
jgi:dephospho-CoA kinase